MPFIRQIRVVIAKFNRPHFCFFVYMPDFSVFNKYFDHIYIISLERLTGRHEKMERLLEGLQYSLFFGTDKKDITIDELVEDGIYDEEKAKHFHKEGKPLNTNQIGCAWSHRLVYEDMLRNKYSKVLILEDNVILHNAGHALINEMLQQLPPDWELWYLDYHKNLRRNIGTYANQLWLHTLRFFHKSKWNHTMINNLYAKTYKPNIFKAGYHNLSTAYAITSSAAKKLVDLQTPVGFCSDNLLSYACSNKIINGYVSVPKVFLRESLTLDKKMKASYVAE